MPTTSVNVRKQRQTRWGLLTACLLLAALLLTVALPAAARPVPRSSASPAQQPSNGFVWQAVHQNPDLSWYTVVFPSRNVGYVAGGPDWNVNNGTGQTVIAKTSDGGQTWTEIPVPNTQRFTRGLDCKDENTCWLAGASFPRLRRTTDGGQTWEVANDHYGYRGWFWSVGYTGDGDTVLAGPTGYFDEDGRRANFLRATDGLNFYAVVADQAGLVQWDFSCPAAGLCVSASKERVYVTSDSGETWVKQAIPAPLGVRFFGVDCVDANTCWVVGRSGRIVLTYDGGASWQNAYVPTSGGQLRFWDVDMVDAQHGYAVGCTNIDTSNDICLGEGMIYRTDDGFTWQQVTAPTTADIMDIHAFSMNEIIVIDWEGTIWYGNIPPTPTPTPTDTPTPTSTPTPTATPTPTLTPSPTPNSGQISGLAFHDLNDNLLWDQDEPGLEGANVALRQGATIVAEATTQGDGAFSFPDVLAGQYTLAESAAPAGYELSTGPVTFYMTAGGAWSFYLPHRLQPTPTPTPTATPTPNPAAGCYCGYLPVIVSGSGVGAGP